ncbi:MAG: response regulator [Trueperaceae bacterium]|nr:response regulator [Trueperaceae bacterium]
MARVLIVEDQLAARVLLKSVLSRAGYQTILAENGAEALEQLRLDPSIDIVVTDIDMPKMDGIELLSRLAAATRPVAAIVVTVYSVRERASWADALHGVDVVEKPFDAYSFLQTLDRVLAAESLAASSSTQ